MKKKSINKNNKRVIAVIPAYNESQHIEGVVKQTLNHVNQVIVVDDCSSDNTAQLARSAGAIVLSHPINLQKGASLKTGCEFAIKNNADIIVMLDADGQHDPNEIPKIIEPLNKVDFVFGCRELNKNMPLTKKAGNNFLSRLSKLLYKKHISDTQSGFRAFNTKIYDKIKWNSSDYGVETEIIRNLAKNDIEHEEVKISTIYNDNYKGTTPIDGMKIAFNMVKGSFS